MFWMAPPSPFVVLSPFRMVRSSRSRCTLAATVKTGPLQILVPQPTAWPLLPSSTGLVTPAAGLMVSEAVVPVLPMTQLPT